MHNLDVTIVGAGPAGIDMALTLAKLVGIRYGVLEGDRVGGALRSWPAQTRLSHLRSIAIRSGMPSTKPVHPLCLLGASIRVVRNTPTTLALSPKRMICLSSGAARFRKSSNFQRMDSFFPLTRMNCTAAS